MTLPDVSGELVVEADQVVLRSTLPVAAGGVLLALPGGAWVLLDLVEPDRVVELGWARHDHLRDGSPDRADLIERLIGPDAWLALMSSVRRLAHDDAIGWDGAYALVPTMPSAGPDAGTLLRCAVIDGVDRWSSLPLDAAVLASERHVARTAAGLPSAAPAAYIADSTRVLALAASVEALLEGGALVAPDRSWASRTSSFVDPARVHARVVVDRPDRAAIVTVTGSGRRVMIAAQASVAVDPHGAEARMTVAELVGCDTGEVVGVVPLRLDESGSSFVGELELVGPLPAYEVELTDARSLTPSRRGVHRRRAEAQDAVLRAWRLCRLSLASAGCVGPDDVAPEVVRLVRRARGLIESTALHPAVIAGDLAAVDRAGLVLGWWLDGWTPSHLAPLAAESAPWGAGQPIPQA